MGLLGGQDLIGFLKWSLLNKDHPTTKCRQNLGKSFFSFRGCTNVCSRLRGNGTFPSRHQTENSCGKRMAIHSPFNSLPLHYSFGGAYEWLGTCKRPPCLCRYEGYDLQESLEIEWECRILWGFLRSRGCPFTHRIPSNLRCNSW